MNVERYGSGTTVGKPPFVDRRRPGVRVEVNPALLPLLRGTGTYDGRDRFIRDWHEHERGPDPLSPARGVAFATLICTGFWLGVASLF